jgi:hypothetical protein
LFVLLTACLSGIFWVLINATQTPNPGYIWLLMWMPGVSALLTCRILRRPLSSLGWSWNWRWVLIGYLIPVAYCLVASLVIWIAGIGGFPNTDVVHKAAALLGLGGAPDWVIIAMFVVLQGTTDDLSRRSARRRDRLACRHRRQFRAGLTPERRRQPVARRRLPSFFSHHNRMQSDLLAMTTEKAYTKWTPAIWVSGSSSSRQAPWGWMFWLNVANYRRGRLGHSRLHEFL